MAHFVCPDTFRSAVSLAGMPEQQAACHCFRGRLRFFSKLIFIWLAIARPVLAPPVHVPPVYAPPVYALLAAYQLKSQRFEPDKYYLGQRVRMVLELQVSDAELDELIELKRRASGTDGQDPNPQILRISLSTGNGDALPGDLNYRIYNVDIFPSNLSKTYVVELGYSVFSTDISRIAAFSVEGFQIPELIIPRAISSLPGLSEASIGLDGIRELPSLDSTPLSLPWVDLSIALLIQVLVLLPILLFQSSRRLRRWVHKLRQRYLSHRPYREFLRQLKLLEQKEGLDAQEYYRVLSSQVRYYLRHRTRYPCAAYTTEELAQLKVGTQPKASPLPTESEVSPVSEARLWQLWQQVLDVLRAGDDLRFRSSVIAAEAAVIECQQKEREVATLSDFARMLERQYRKRQQELLHV